MFCLFNYLLIHYFDITNSLKSGKTLILYFDIMNLLKSDKTRYILIQ